MRAIGPPLSDKERLAFIAEARSYVNPPVRFRHQGRSRRGVDCAGLLLVSMTAIGRTVQDLRGYQRGPLNGKLRAMLVANLGDPVPKESMHAGDVVMMCFLGDPTHVGLIANHPHGGLSLIHSFAQVKKVVEHGIDAEWMDHIVEVWRP